MAAQSQEEFVDLYRILELVPDAEPEMIRKRINTLYLEAQQNLDHRNLRKRLQYQQMYEIYLPQARHLLLDVRRRSEYDRYLEAYRSGEKVAPEEPAAKAATEAAVETAPPLQEVEPPLPNSREAEEDPEVVAAQRDALWDKWKQGLEEEAISVSTPTEESRRAPEPEPQMKIEEEASPAQPSAEPASQSTSASASTTPAAADATPQAPAPAQPKPAPRKARTPSIGSPAGGLSGGPTEEEIARQKEIERQQDIHREEIIGEAAQNAALVSGMAWGVGIFLVGCVGLYILLDKLEEYPLGMSSGVFSALCLLLLVGIAVFGGKHFSQKARLRVTSELSLLPYEKLPRQ